MPEPRRLNLGCGHDVREGYVNLDRLDLPGVDVVHDLETFPYPFDDESFDEILAQDILEHLRDTVRVMEELWRLLKPGATLRVRVPHAQSPNAAQDPTHVSRFTEHTFEYFTARDAARPGSRYSFYSRARFEILSVKVDHTHLRVLRSRRLARLVLGREIELDHGNVHCVLRKIAPP